MTYASDVLADSPEAYWKLDETSGSSAADASGNGHTGTYTGTYTLNSTAPPMGGGSVDLNSGRIDFTRIAHNTSQTREAWIYTTTNDTSTSFGGQPPMVILGDTDGGVWDGFGVNGSNIQWRRYNIAGTTASASTGSETVNDGTWHHVVLTYDSTTGPTSNLYVDGVLDQTDGWYPNASFGGITSIGCGYGPADYFIGKIAHVAFYTYVLTDTQIADHYASGTAAGSDIVAGLSGTGAVTGSITGAGARTASLSGTSSITADLGAAGADMVAALSGAGALSAVWSAEASIQAALTGTGSLSGEFLVQQLGDLISWGQVSTGWARQRSQIGTTITITDAALQWAADPVEAASR